ncbi:MAG: acylneuraminate cytidylyltransferase family protein, partial [Spirochaetota bacterium]
MFRGHSILALIPARGESEGLTRKNITFLSGKPLLAWSIEEALKISYIDKLIVSSEDEEVIRIGRKYGAEVPFIRPRELATKEAKTIDVVLHAITWFKQRDEAFDLFLLLQPTSPLRKSDDINNALEQLFQKRARAIVSVCEVDHHPYWSNTLPDDLCMSAFLREDAVNRNRQELPKYYRLNGAVYLGYSDYIVENRGFFGHRTFAYIMKKE